MRYVIVGAGRVGLRTARALRESGHEVVLVDRSHERAERARTDGFDVIEGDGSVEETLRDAGLETADALGGLTGDLNTNFAACLIADHHDCRTVMRIDEDYREEIYRKYADEVDEIVYPERLGAIAAKNALLGGSVRAIADVAHDVQLVELTITDASPVRGYSISELELPANTRLLAFGKADEPLTVPTDDVSLERGDRLVVVAEFDVLGDVRNIVVGETGRAALGGA
ncbi:potassium channel family protein [Halapricum desulfuricans]|uniref:TrkA, K+ transport system, NAD-binding component n=1 Tax=Halapricum desulfuricans TaxID=2841257 RepID=A0A897NYX2_9EURY|nr:TrkA family potassium uptake protein [Halapricum desulfuricans]QSG15276.1 TrkA, K+ transport system, NAD-binding component [Halapricum desulfuricans]